MGTLVLSSLARLLIQHNKLSLSDAERLQVEANSNRVPFIERLVYSRKIAESEIASLGSQIFGYPMMDLDQLNSSYIPHGLVSNKTMQSKRVVPLFRRANWLYIGISDATDLQAIEEIRFQTGLQIIPIVVEDNKLIALQEKLTELSAEDTKNIVMDHVELDVTGINETAEQQDVLAAIEVDDAPVVKYIQKMLLDAINHGASDVHFEPYEKFYRVRYRVDGVLYEVAQPPIAFKEKLASRIKVISKLDISEKRVPQDGRMKLALSKHRTIDFRVSTLPTLHGEKLCMRILDPSSAVVEIDALGYEPEQKKALLEAIHRPYGMVLVTGPTGSGKTLSLYTCLNILNRPDVNISTAEDPAEINLAGINQCNVNDKAGLTFAVALRAFLRQDPDVIMVGEIRDFETADIAVKAAQTGHMVFSTVHTNDAPTTLTRMLSMGIAPFNIASSVILITAQRLARRLCPHCKKEANIPIEVLLAAGFCEADLDGTWQPYHSVGCNLCKNTGYKGRIGLFQVMPISDTLSRIIMQNGDAIDIADQARREGVKDLRYSGLLKVKRGLTSLEEIMAVTNE